MVRAIGLSPHSASPAASPTAHYSGRRGEWAVEKGWTTTPQEDIGTKKSAM